MKFKAAEIRRIVETTDWDNELIRQESKINAACWAIAAIGAVYFGYVSINMYLR